MTTVSLSDPSQISTLKDRFSPMPVSTKSTPALAPLRLIQVSQQYDNLAQPEKPLQILDRVDLSISAGQTIALSGPSGCGKSTLLQVIAGNLSPTEGEVWWGDERIDTLNEDERARWRLNNIGMIFQDFRLFPHLSAIDNIALPLELLGHSPQESREAAIPLLCQLKLDHRAEHRPDTLSGGERQRVALARALVTRPTLLIADEPTGNLDQETAEQVEQLLLNQASVHQVALLYVTHDLRFASRAQQHWGLHQGRLLQRTFTDQR